MISPGVDSSNLREMGWAILFSADGDRAVHEALMPLIEVRRRQAQDRFRIFEGSRGFAPGETVSRFLSRLGASPSAVNPDRLPYFLLIVGSPQQIPFGVERQLAATYAVGRVCFDEGPEAYGRYAANVVGAERGELRTGRHATLFATRHGEEANAAATARFLFSALGAARTRFPDWQRSFFVGEEATKQNLLAAMEQGSALLVAAGHAALLAEQDPEYAALHGALLCEEWPGPLSGEPVSPTALLAARDVPARPHLRGGIALLWASCSAGVWPGWEAERSTTQPGGTVGALPQRLLSQSGGGALAVAGFLDRIVGHPAGSGAFAGRYAYALSEFLQRLAAGGRIGDAMRNFAAAYAYFSNELSQTLEQIRFGATVPDAHLAGLWLAMHDLRALTVLGDPAVRLPVVGLESES